MTSVAAAASPAFTAPAALTAVAVLGAGSYGTALACVLANNGRAVRLYCRSEAQRDAINATRRNPKRFPSVELPASITATSSVRDAVRGAACVLHCVPAQHTPQFVRENAAALPTGVPYVSTSKGVHVASHMLMSDAIPKALGEHAARIPLAFLSGPSFAKEMVAGHPMMVVVASKSLETATRVQGVINSPTFRIYVTDDVIGVEVGGALKNPLAIGAGMASGLGYGQSTIAGLVTRGCREMAMLSIALGGRAETLAGLSGAGDLMLTCFSSLSRNNRFGAALAKGKTVDEAIEEIGEVVEGYPTAAEVARLAEENGLHLPLFMAVHAILKGDIAPEAAILKLMSLPPGLEKPVPSPRTNKRKEN
jgi:glycerol-3-phosphate dehydrogenase